MTGVIPGFGYTDTSVAAKLSLDIPTDSVEILKNVDMYSADIASSMSAAARFSGEYMQYLEQFPQIQRQVLDNQKQFLQVIRDSVAAMDQLKQSSIGYTGVTPPLGGGMSSQYYGAYAPPTATDRDTTPRGYVDANSQQNSQPANFGMRDSQVSQYIAATGSPVTPVGPINGAGYNPYAGINPQRTREQEIDRQRRLREDQEEHNRRTQRGRHRDEDEEEGRHHIREPGGRHRAPEDEEEETDRQGTSPTGQRGGFMHRLHNAINTGSNLLNTGLGAVGPDGTPIAGRAALGARVLQGIGGLGKAGTALGAALPVVGMAGLGIGAAGLAFNAVQNIGEDIQGYRNQDLHKHTLGGGLAVEKDVMLMSLNPLLTSEQSRSIVMGALQTGRAHGSESYSSAVDFIKKNLVDMNMSVSDSVGLLHNNVEIGKASIESVKMDLAGLATTAANGGKTTAEVQQQYQQLSDLIVNTMGSTNGNGPRVAHSLTNVFAETEADGTPDPLHEKTADITSKLLTGPGIQDLLTQQYAPGQNPKNIFSILSDNKDPDTTRKALWGAGSPLEKGFDMATRASKDKTKQKDLFFNWLTAMAPQFGAQDRGDINLIFDKIQAGRENPEESIEKQAEGIDAISNIAQINGKDASSMETSSEWLKKNPGKHIEDYYKATGIANPLNPDDPNRNKQKIVANKINEILKTTSDVLALDPDGGYHYLDPTDSDQVIGLANGHWRIQHTGLPTHGSTAPFTRTSNNSIVGGDKVREKNTELTGPKVTLGDYGGGIDPKSTLDEPWTTVKNSDGSVSISGAKGNITSQQQAQSLGTFTLSPEARRLLQFLDPGNINNSDNTAKANAGVGGATTNSAPPTGTKPIGEAKGH